MFGWLRDVRASSEKGQDVQCVFGSFLNRSIEGWGEGQIRVTVSPDASRRVKGNEASGNSLDPEAGRSEGGGIRGGGVVVVVGTQGVLGKKCP